MPISCPIQFPRLTQDEMRTLDYEVMKHAFASQKALGRLGDETIYQAHLAHLLTRAGIPAEREVPVTLTFRSFLKTLYLDLVVNRSAIYELKAVTALVAAHVSQLLNYLFLTNASRGKLVNFRTASVESQFVNSSLDDAERRRFSVEDRDWMGPTDFRQMILELVTDWGTALEQSLYTQAVVHGLGGEEAVHRQVPMTLDGISLGSQHFQMMNAETAFRVTTFQEGISDEHLIQLRKLTAPSPLTTFHCINISRHQLQLRTVKL